MPLFPAPFSDIIRQALTPSTRRSKERTDISTFNDKQNEGIAAKLLQAKTPSVLPFRQSIDSINTLHNKPHRIAVDKENVYFFAA